MHNVLLAGIAMVIGLGTLAQWVAWRVRLPSIVFLLLIGLLIGPVSARFLDQPLLDVEHLLGDLLFPIVSASVAVILFEGGLSLRFKDIRGSGGVVGNLVTIGVFVSWITSGLVAYYLLGLSIEISLLLGATLVVTGPTVIIPLLKQIRPKGRVGSILRWEGIVIDPVGAVLAVLVFEEILSGPPSFNALWSLLRTVVIGLSIGWLTAQLMLLIFRRYWVPDTLQNPVTLGFLLAAFAVSNGLQAESGLLTVTVMGIVMANQDRFDISHIVEFKETLQVLLLSSLFILLAARMRPADLAQIGWPVLAFVAFVIVIQRPLVVLISTWGSDLSWQERVFIAWMAPRGIVAASVASIFALELVDHGIEQGEMLVPVTFAVILGTVLTYSFSSGILARRLGLAERDPQGLLIVGASRWAREIAREISQAGFRVIIVDTNRGLIDRAEHEGLEHYHGNILSERAKDEISFGGIGRMLALTANAEVNALAAEHLESTFGSDAVFELQRPAAPDERAAMSRHLGGRRLFYPTCSYDQISRRFQAGARVMTVEIDQPQAISGSIPDAIMPLFILDNSSRLTVVAQDDPPRLYSGQRIIALVESEFYDELLSKRAIKPRREDFDTRVFPQVIEG